MTPTIVSPIMAVPPDNHVGAKQAPRHAGKQGRGERGGPLMDQHISHLEQTCTCYACGRERYVTATRPFGRHADGTVATRVCLVCADAVTIEKPRPIPSSVAALAWTTVARADRLVALGAARTTDHAMRQGLALLERQAVEARLTLTPKGTDA